MAKDAIFLSGPVGAGKTTLGRTLAERLAGGFIDGDDFSDSDRPWYCSILRTSKAMAQAGLAALEGRPTVIIACPLNCINWIYFRRRFGEAGIRPFFVSLRVSYPSVICKSRGRVFSNEEHDRIQVMIAEGYGARPFSDLVIDTDTAGFAATLAHLESETRRMIAS